MEPVIARLPHIQLEPKLTLQTLRIRRETEQCEKEIVNAHVISKASGKVARKLFLRITGEDKTILLLASRRMTT